MEGDCSERFIPHGNFPLPDSGEVSSAFLAGGLTRNFAHFLCATRPCSPPPGHMTPVRPPLPPLGPSGTGAKVNGAKGDGLQPIGAECLARNMRGPRQGWAWGAFTLHLATEQKSCRVNSTHLPNKCRGKSHATQASTMFGARIRAPALWAFHYPIYGAIGEIKPMSEERVPNPSMTCMDEKKRKFLQHSKG